MSKKFEICSATYNIALNQDEDDVFRTGCAHLYHFLHGNGNNGRSEECKPMMLKMHLELNESIEETEEQIVEPSNSNNPERPFIQQPEAKVQSLEDSLQSTDDVVNKIIKRMEQLEKNLSNIVGNKLADVGNNTIDHESNNVLLSTSDNAPTQSTRQLEAKLKTLEDSLQAKDDVVNKIMERMEKLENNISKNVVDKTPDVGNNTIDHESNNAARQSVQQLEKEVKDLKDRIEQIEHNKAVNETIDCKEYQTTPKEKQEIQFDKNNLIQIWRINSFDSSLETAIHNVIKYAEKMDLSLTRDQIKHIDVHTFNQNTLHYYVFFRTKTIKEAFLMKSDILTSSPHKLRIRNESAYNTVYIRNFKPFNLSLESAYDNVIGLAKQMGLTLMRNQIKEIDWFSVTPVCLVFCVELFTTPMENEFLKRSHILKELPASKSFEIY